MSLVETNTFSTVLLSYHFLRGKSVLVKFEPRFIKGHIYHFSSIYI